MHWIAPAEKAAAASALDRRLWDKADAFGVRFDAHLFS